MRRNEIRRTFSRVGHAEHHCPVCELTAHWTMKFPCQKLIGLPRTRFLQICSHLHGAAVRIAFADGYAQIMLPFMLPWCSSELLLTAWSKCSRVAAMGADLIGSASLAHSSCMINMVSSWTRAYAGAEALQRVHVCVVVGRRDHEVSASW